MEKALNLSHTKSLEMPRGVGRGGGAFLKTKYEFPVGWVGKVGEGLLTPEQPSMLGEWMSSVIAHLFVFTIVFFL